MWIEPSAVQVLPAERANDYERYLRTNELLALQPGPDRWAHRDELLFTTVHQSSELSLKLAYTEVGEATRLISPATSWRPRSGSCAGLTSACAC